jgi:hypothetical protein
MQLEIENTIESGVPVKKLGVVGNNLLKFGGLGGETGL